MGRLFSLRSRDHFKMKRFASGKGAPKSIHGIVEINRCIELVHA